MADERIDKIEKEFAEFRKDFKEVSESLKNMVSEKAEDHEARVRRGLRRAQNKAGHVLSDVRERGEEMYDQVRDHLSDATGCVETRVRENPLTALAMVAGIGFLIGFCSRR